MAGVSDVQNFSPEHLKARYDDLVALIHSFGEVVVAYSGGIDSTLVAYSAARALPDTARAIFFSTPLLAPEESIDAQALAQELGLPFEMLTLNPLSVEAVAFNHEDRCYHCKQAIFSQLQGLFPGVVVLDGTNYDDLFADRPGLRALKQLGIKSPLAQLEIGKEEVRAMAKMLGLPNYAKPSAPCLATRFEVGAELTPQKLVNVAQAEDLLRAAGFTYVRVRDHGASATIEVHPNEVERLEAMQHDIATSLKPFYERVAVAPRGYRGSTK